VVTALRAHRARQAEERLQAGQRWADTWGLVFTTPIGRPLHASVVYHQWRRHLDALGIPPNRFHALRHTAGALMLLQGADLREVMDALGHGQLSTTAKLYAHVQQRLKERSAERMGEWLEQAPGTSAEGY